MNDLYDRPSIHNELTELILQRIKYIVGFKGYTDVERFDIDWANEEVVQIEGPWPWYPKAMKANKKAKNTMQAMKATKAMQAKN